MFVSKNLVFSLQLSRKDEGVYKATLSDDRGHDVSSLELSGKGNILQWYNDLHMFSRGVKDLSLQMANLHIFLAFFEFHFSYVIET